MSTSSKGNSTAAESGAASATAPSPNTKAINEVLSSLREMFPSDGGRKGISAQNSAGSRDAAPPGAPALGGSSAGALRCSQDAPDSSAQRASAFLDRLQELIGSGVPSTERVASASLPGSTSQGDEVGQQR